MPIPKRMEGWDFGSIHKGPSEEELKIREMMRIVDEKLFSMGFYPEDEWGVVKCIEENHLDVSQFDFPGGSFEMFRINVLAGKYDVKIYYMTEERKREIEEGIASGKYTVTY